jgi:hypothetical protein
MQRGLGCRTKIPNNTAKTKNLITATALLTAVATNATNWVRRTGAGCRKK